MNSRKQANNPSAAGSSGKVRWFRPANIFKGLLASGVIAVAAVAVTQMAAGSDEVEKQVVATVDRDSPDSSEVTAQPTEERSAEPETTTSEVVKTVATTVPAPTTTQPQSEETGSEEETVTEEEEEGTTVEDPEGETGSETSESEETGSEEETVTEEEEEGTTVEDPEGETGGSAEFVFEIRANPAWAAERNAIENFGRDCGWYENECSLEDLQTLQQMLQDFYGNECETEIGFGGCVNLSGNEMRALSSLRACPVGWSLQISVVSGDECFHPKHEYYTRWHAYHAPENADPQGVPSDYWP